MAKEGSPQAHSQLGEFGLADLIHDQAKAAQAGKAEGGADRRADGADRLLAPETCQRSLCKVLWAYKYPTGYYQESTAPLFELNNPAPAVLCQSAFPHPAADLGPTRFYIEPLLSLYRTGAGHEGPFKGCHMGQQRAGSGGRWHVSRPQAQLTWLGCRAFVQKMSGPSPELPAICQAVP